MLTDFGKFDAPPQLHLSFLTLHEYKKLNSRLPKPWSSEDAADFLKVVRFRSSKHSEILNSKLTFDVFLLLKRLSN